MTAFFAPWLLLCLLVFAYGLVDVWLADRAHDRRMRRCNRF